MSYKKVGLWLGIPGFAGFLLFYILPFLYSFYYAVIDDTFNKSFVGLKNFIEIIGNKYFRLAMKNTLEFTCIGVPVLVLLSFVIALLMVSCGQKLNFLRAAFIMPILLPSSAVVMVWNVYFGSGSLFLRLFSDATGSVKSDILMKLPIFLFFIWKNAGFNMILFISGLLSIPKEIYEAADVEGVNFLQKNIYITFPLLRPTTFFVLVISIVNSFKIFKETYLLYGSYPGEALYFVQHYMNNHFFKMNYQNLAAGAIIFAVIVYVIVALSYKAENRLNKGVW